MRTLLAILTVFATIAIGFQSRAADELTAHDVILQSSNKVITILREHNGETAEDIQALSHQLTDILEHVVDFKSITKAVMGPHYKTATEEQRKKFLPIFKNTMVYLYAKSMVKFKIVNIDVIPPADGVDLESKGNVSMAVTTDEGKIYSIVYTMRKNKNNQWKVRNIVLDGINLGLTYRNQFDSATLGNEGDIDQTIADWAGKMDS